jgi:hypothetical protein
MKLCTALLLCMLPIGSLLAADSQENRSPEAVMAVDDGWMNAEIRGDSEFLNSLLLDGYVSVGSSGKVTTKEQIVSAARKRGQSADFAKQVADWKAHHPIKAQVQMFGDMAVLTWVLSDPKSNTPVTSSDIFVYRSGHWHAIYSQHTTATE